MIINLGDPTRHVTLLKNNAKETIKMPSGAIINVLNELARRMHVSYFRGVTRYRPAARAESGIMNLDGGIGPSTHYG